MPTLIWGQSFVPQNGFQTVVVNPATTLWAALENVFLCQATDTSCQISSQNEIV